MYFTNAETDAIMEMLEYIDTDQRPSDLQEIVGVLRFKTLEDKFIRAEEMRKANNRIEVVAN